MEYKDYYSTLGVPRTATPAQIKKAFRSLARKHHPDVNKGDAVAERRFKEITEANEVLADPEKKKLYDQLGADWESYQRAGAAGAASGGARGAGGRGTGDPFAGFGGFAGGRSPGGGAAGGPGGVRFEFHGDSEDLAGFSDFFRTFFAGGAPPGGGGSASAAGAGPSRGGRVSGAQEASLEEMLAGFRGGGFEVDGHRPSLPRHDAEAEAEISLEEAFHGTERRVEIEGRRLDIRIPPGVDTGRRIRLSGKAGSGPGAGDLYLRVKVQPHPTFTRSGTELRRELRITLGEALFGGEVPVQTLKGRVLLNIPPGTQSGRVFRLKSQGMPAFGASEADASAGDMLVTIRVILPTLDEGAQEAGRHFVELARQPDPRG
ncbi:MAG: J domain-containing protein [Candidatus Limnocylindrales bacterium]